MAGTQISSGRTIENWDFSASNIEILPDFFGNDLVLSGSLDLRDNVLRTLPEAFGNIRAACNLELRGNRLDSLPENISGLVVGGLLNLRGNLLTSLPASFGNISHVGHLDLSANRIKSLPESFGKLNMRGNLCVARPSQKPKPLIDAFLGVQATQWESSRDAA